jgi:hypothetical protein
MYQKAKFADDKQRARDIMATGDPVAQLNFGKQIVLNNKAEWGSVSKKTMTDGLRAKLEQNPELTFLNLLELLNWSRRLHKIHSGVLVNPYAPQTYLISPRGKGKINLENILARSCF